MSKLLREQWARLAFGKGNTSINESADQQSVVDSIVHPNIVENGPEIADNFYGSLVRAGTLSDFETQVMYSPSLKDIFRDFLGDCDDHSIDPEEALGYIREKYAIPRQMQKNSKTSVKKWYGGSV